VRRSESLALIDQLVVSAANFFTGVVVGRACTKDEFGLYMLGLSVALIATAPQASLVSQPYIVFSPRLTEKDRAGFTGSVLTHQLVLSAIAGVLLLGLGFVLSRLGEYEALASVVKLLAGLIILILFRDFARRVCFANLEFREAMMIDVTSSVLQIGLICWFYLTGTLSALTALISLAVAGGIGGVLWLVRSRGKIVFDFKRSVQDFLRNWAFGRWLFYSALVWKMASNIYPWLLTAFYGTSATGVLAACSGVIAFANPISLGVVNVVGPKISHIYAEEGKNNFRKNVQNILIFATIVIFPFCLIFFVAGEWIVVFLYGSKYDQTGPIVALLGVNLFFHTVGVPVSRALHALERSDLDFAVNCVPLAIMLSVGVVLVRDFGVVGVAWGLVAGSATATVVRWVALDRFTRSAGWRERG
jgi:O-antigen/teichoic acid export membrane protein